MAKKCYRILFTSDLNWLKKDPPDNVIGIKFVKNSGVFYILRANFIDRNY